MTSLTHYAPVFGQTAVSGGRRAAVVVTPCHAVRRGDRFASARELNPTSPVFAEVVTCGRCQERAPHATKSADWVVHVLVDGTPIASVGELSSFV